MATSRAVIFDIGGVLLRLGTQEYLDELRKVLGREGVDGITTEMWHKVERGELDEEELWERIAGRPMPHDTFDDAFLRHFTPMEAMLAFARELRQAGVRTAILSNTIRSHVRAMRRMGFLDEFDPVVLSCEIGSRKPEPEAIGRVIDVLGLPPERIAYIDDVPAYVEMGRQAGVYAVLHEGDVDATRRAILGWLDGAAGEEAGAL